MQEYKRPEKPGKKPACPHFSSGPCAKPPGWTVDHLKQAILGRSHRGAEAKDRLRQVIDQSKNLLSIPDDWVVGIVPASDTGAVEMALWSLIGERGVDVLSFDSFSHDWAIDLQDQLKPLDLHIHAADYGELPDLSNINPARDFVLTWNGTTSGVVFPAQDLPTGHHEQGSLVICDATSAVFAYDLPWSRLDAVTWSWQKILGGEAAHGMLALSPRAVARLTSYTPPWPIPKIFRMTKNGKLIDGLFKGETINTPSMLCVEDVLYALSWVEQIGGLPATMERSQQNLDIISDWVAERDWIDFLAKDERIRSRTAICLELHQADPKAISSLLAKEGVAFDINSYRTAPPGFRLWGGATVEPEDTRLLLPWIDWAYHHLSSIT